MTEDEPRTDAEIAGRIAELAAEEHRIRNDGDIGDAERARLGELDVELDRLYDLKRQRRGRRDAGEDPAQAHERPPGVVEGYRQ
jgi:hypothetical protein